MFSALALALALAAEPAPRPTPPPARAGETRRAAPLSDEDAAIVEHLELLQGMELLEDLPVVEAGDGDADAAHEHEDEDEE